MVLILSSQPEVLSAPGSAPQGLCSGLFSASSRLLLRLQPQPLRQNTKQSSIISNGSSHQYCPISNVVIASTSLLSL